MTTVNGAGGIGMPGELPAGDGDAARTDDPGSLSFGELLGGAMVASAAAGSQHPPAVPKPVPLSLDAGPAAIASAALQSGIIEFHEAAPTDELAAALRTSPLAGATGSAPAPSIAVPISMPSPGPKPPTSPAPTSFAELSSMNSLDMDLGAKVEIQVALPAAPPIVPPPPTIPLPPAGATPEVPLAIPPPAAIAASIPSAPIDAALAAKPKEQPAGPAAEAPVLAPRPILPVTPSSPLPGLYAGALRVRPAASTVPPLAQVPGAARPIAAHHPFAAGTEPSLSLEKPAAEPGVEALEPKPGAAVDARLVDASPAHAPPHHQSHGPASPGADAKALPDAAVDRAAPAQDPEPPRTGELGPSSARVTVGEGDSRVALWIAVRGESVRVEARAHNAAYADAINQRADELASGLADRGLQLGSMSADVAGDRAGHQQAEPQQRDDRRRAAEPDRPDDGPEPDRPRPRGVRAIA